MHLLMSEPLLPFDVTHATFLLPPINGKQRYFGPLMVAKRLRNGNYHLAEVNGALSKLKYAAYRLIPYYPRCRKRLLITEVLGDAELAEVEEDQE